MTAWLSVIGIGEDGLAALSPTAKCLVETAQTLVGGVRHLGLVPDGDAERLRWRQPLSDTFAEIAARRGTRVAVLASGDPLWYGVAVALLRHFPQEEITIIPQASAFSLAAARLGWPLAQCIMLSLHGRPLDALRLHLAPDAWLLLLSQDGATPRQVAALLAAEGWGESAMTVLSHLGGPAESVAHATAQEWGERPSPDLNVVALECKAGREARPLSLLAGLPDDAFSHDGQLTKRDIRAVTLARLAPLPGETLWDIGAGCGSIAIEWLRASRGGRAVAVERDRGRAAMIARNAAALGVPQLEIVVEDAVKAIARLAACRPAPDAIFVGGGVGDAQILPAAWTALRPGGRLVANAVSLDAERALFDWQGRYRGELSRIAVAHAAPLGRQQVWRPMLPVTQLAVGKPR